jgi:hypothetical protein
MRILDVDVPADLRDRWVAWLAPERQPFYLTSAQIGECGLIAGERPTDPQLRDTYTLYDVTPGLDVVWLDKAAFDALPGPIRAGIVRAQVDHGRGARLAWPRQPGAARGDHARRRLGAQQTVTVLARAAGGADGRRGDRVVAYRRLAPHPPPAARLMSSSSARRGIPSMPGSCRRTTLSTGPDPMGVPT